MTLQSLLSDAYDFSSPQAFIASVERARQRIASEVDALNVKINKLIATQAALQSHRPEMVAAGDSARIARAEAAEALAGEKLAQLSAISGALVGTLVGLEDALADPEALVGTWFQILENPGHTLH
jgi:hypothetical protein